MGPDQFIEDTADKYEIDECAVREIFWTAFRAYLNREIRRHEKDIQLISADEMALASLGIPFVNVPTDYWTKVPKRKGKKNGI